MADVVVVPLPMHGHINPMLQLSAALASMGITVAFVATSVHQASSSSSETNISVCELQVEAAWRTRFTETTDIEAIWNSLFFMMEKKDEITELVSRWTRGPSTPIVVLDFVLFDVLLKPLQEQGYTVALFSTFSGAGQLLHFHIDKLAAYIDLPENASASATIDSSVIPGITVLNVVEDIPYNFPELSRLKLDCKQAMQSCSMILLNSFMELEGEAIAAMQQEGLKIVPIGPLLLLEHPSANQAGECSLHEWLSKQRTSSVLYVSLGTIASLGEDQTRKLAAGLEECNYSFLWVLRRESIPWLPENFLARTHDRGKLVHWCPQQEVLKHASIGGFLTHCGWNSTLEALSAGVPMLCCPLLVEQNLNCKYITDVWKLGKRLRLRENNLTAGDISQAIQDVMVDKELRANSAKWRTLAHLAASSGRKALLQEMVSVISYDSAQARGLEILTQAQALGSARLEFRSG